MKPQHKRTIGIVLLIIIVIIVFIVWLKPQNESVDERSPGQSAQVLDEQQNALSLKSADPKQLQFASPSQQDVEINCQVAMDASNRLIVNEATKNCFEFFITQYGEKDIAQIKIDFVKYAQATYQDPLLAQLTDLWSRYMQYREQLGHLSPPAGNKESVQYFKNIFNQMKSLRQQFFSAYEIEGLFGTEDVYNNYTLDRMTILENNTLSEAEKAAKLQTLFDALPEDWKENLKQLSQLEDLRKLTADIKARGGSAAEIREMRLNLVGPEATQRLEHLDVQRSDWKQRVDGYLQSREQILNSSMSDSAKQTAIQNLKQKQFNTPQEQLRLETFESVHDQGGKLPYGE